MSNYFNNKNLEEKERNKKAAKNSLLIVLALVICFFGTYFITDRLTNTKYTDNKDLEEKTVYNNTKALEDDMVIVTMSEGVVEKEESVADFKKNNSIASDINEQFIINFFTANGYKLESLEDSKVVFAKENTALVLEPNKYYLGEKDGYFAIYKTNDNGELTIESENDIYKNSRPISFFEGTEDISNIKNFKECYSTKEEAIQKLSAYLS